MSDSFSKSFVPLYKHFDNPEPAVFLSRPNRFVVIADLQGKRVRVHCPNPGKLTEILTPNRQIFLEKQKNPSAKTPYRLVSAEYRGNIVPLYSAKANNAFENLILPQFFPHPKEFRREVSFPGSRFDFLVKTEQEEHIIEVKACTLVEEGTAMFPDAQSKRASKHIIELGDLKNKGYHTHVFFLIMNPEAKRFVPNLHTDPDFAINLNKLRNIIDIHAVTLHTTPEGEMRIHSTSIPIITSAAAIAEENSGVYLLLLRLEEDRLIKIGKLGDIFFKKGWYVYTGSAKQGMDRRISRHYRKRKTMHWHIDYLRQEAAQTVALPIYTRNPLECQLADAVASCADDKIKQFGSSDCSCNSHLHYFSHDPRKQKDFLHVLFQYWHKTALNP
ncbi:MAG: DNA/RNA nuclease SfsA [Spirochaetia bacterium]